MALGSIGRRGGVLALTLLFSGSGCSRSEPAASPPPAARKAATRADATLAAGGARPPARTMLRRSDDRVAQPAAELPPATARGPLLHRLPKSTLLAVRVPHVEKLDEAWRRTPLAGLLQMPQLSEQREQILAGLAQVSADLSRQIPEFDAMKAKLLGIEGELVVALIALDASAFTSPGGRSAEWPITAAMLLDAGAHAGDVDAFLHHLFALTERRKDEEQGHPLKLVAGSGERWHRRATPDGGCIDVVREGSQFLLQFGPAATARLDGTPLAPRAIDNSFAAADVVRGTPDLAGEGAQPVAELFVNLAPIWTVAEMFAPAEVKNAIAGSGVTSITGISLAAGLGRAGIDEVLTILSPGGRDLLTQILTNRPLDPKLARYVPVDAAMASITSFDFAALFDGIVKLMPAAEKQQFDSMLVTMKADGFDLRGDLIGNIGPTFAFVGGAGLLKMVTSNPLPGASLASPAVMRGALDFTLIVELQDVPRFKRMFDRFVRSSGMAAHVRPEVVQGMPASRVDAVPVPGPDGEVLAVIEPCWHVGDHAFVFSASSAALERSLAAARVAGNRGPARMKDQLDRHGEAAWAVSTTAAVAGLPESTSLGRRTPLGLELVSREGPGTTSAYLLGGGTAIVAAVAIPKLLSARLEGNEAAAVATLRAISAAQAQFRSAAHIDQDGDGRGEFGSLAELAGAAPLPGRKAPLSPAALSLPMTPDSRGCYTRSGYVFRVDVPRRAIAGADAAEQRFVAYAWPMVWNSTGGRVYVVDESGRIFFSDNRGDQQRYEGQQRVPAADAAELRDASDRVTGVTAVRRGRDLGVWLEHE